MLLNDTFTDEIKRGFLLCLLSSDQPLHQLLRHNHIDQTRTLDEHFKGMTEDNFTYEEFEATRLLLDETIKTLLTDNDRSFILSFKAGEPEWEKFGFSDFEKFPAIQWKLHNIRKLKTSNRTSHQQQYLALEKILKASSSSSQILSLLQNSITKMSV